LLVYVIQNYMVNRVAEGSTNFFFTRMANSNRTDKNRRRFARFHQELI